MKGDLAFESYVGVPTGSTLELWFEGNPGEVNIEAQVSDGVAPATIKESLLIPGPFVYPLPAAGTYIALFVVSYLAESQPVLLARVRKPGGELFSETARWEVPGKPHEHPLRGVYVKVV